MSSDSDSGSELTPRRTHARIDPADLGLDSDFDDERPGSDAGSVVDLTQATPSQATPSPDIEIKPEPTPEFRVPMPDWDLQSPETPGTRRTRSQLAELAVGSPPRTRSRHLSRSPLRPLPHLTLPPDVSSVAWGSSRTIPRHPPTDARGSTPTPPTPTRVMPAPARRSPRLNSPIAADATYIGPRRYERGTRRGGRGAVSWHMRPATPDLPADIPLVTPDLPADIPPVTPPTLELRGEPTNPSAPQRLQLAHPRASASIHIAQPGGGCAIPARVQSGRFVPVASPPGAWTQVALDVTAAVDEAMDCDSDGSPMFDISTFFD